MKLSVIFKIALKSLLGKKTRTLLTVGGVVVGIAAIVFLVSLAYGVQELVIEKATGLDALRVIDVSTVKSKIIKLDRDSVERLEAFSEVESVEPLINAPGTINYGGSATDVVVFAASPEYLTMASVNTAKGRYYNPDESGILVNTSVLNLIGVSEDNYEGTVGEKASVDILLQAEMLGKTEETDNKDITKELSIVGVIDDTETPYIFIPLDLLKTNGVVNYSQAKVKVTDSENLDGIREQIEAMGFGTSSAADTVQQIDQIFSIFRIILGSFGAIALIVSALGMFNTLTVSLLERTREVGLMKALGAKRNAVFGLFLSEALIISVIGGLLGVFLGWAGGEGANFLLNRLAASTGNDPVDIFTTPIVFVLGIILFSFFVGFFTGMYPSGRASRLNPLDALRYE